MKTLIILAAGKGSRFGGPKQLTGFGPLNRPLMAYNIDHAHQAGYRKFVIVCQQKHGQLIQTLPLYQHFSDSEYHTVIQDNNHLPESVEATIGHSNPLGTAHALWCCHELIDDNFTVINGDDYYGEHAFALLYTANAQNKNKHYLVGYLLKNTLSEHGGVNRGICTVSSDNKLLTISEVTNIQKSSEGVISDTKREYANNLNENSLVSMNCWSFHPQILTTIAKLIGQSLSSLNNKRECYLPDAAMQAIQVDKTCIEVLTSHDEWFGVTYAADSDIVHNKLALLTEKGLFH